MESTALVTKGDALPATFDELSNMAKAFVASGMFQDTKQLSQAIVKIQAGKELGLAPVYSMQNINMIRNRLTSSANTMAMLVKRSGRYNYRIKEHTEQVCTITFFEQDGGKWVEIGESSFSMTDAKRADLVKPDSGWVKYPRAMLFSRAISQGARIYAPDAIGGMYTDEEVRSIPPRPTEDVSEESPEKIIEGESEEVPEEKKEPPKEGKGKRDPTTIKNINELMKACFDDFGMQQNDVLAELGVDSKTQISDLADAYAQVAGSRK